MNESKKYKSLLPPMKPKVKRVRAWLLITDSDWEKATAFLEFKEAKYWKEIYRCKTAEIFSCIIEYKETKR